MNASFAQKSFQPSIFVCCIKKQSMFDQVRTSFIKFEQVSSSLNTSEFLFESEHLKSNNFECQFCTEKFPTKYFCQLHQQTELIWSCFNKSEQFIYDSCINLWQLENNSN